MVEIKLKPVLRSQDFKGLYEIMLLITFFKKNHMKKKAKVIEKCITNYIKMNFFSIMKRLDNISKTSKDGKAMITFINKTYDFTNDDVYLYKLVELNRKFKGIYHIC